MQGNEKKFGGFCRTILTVHERQGRPITTKLTKNTEHMVDTSK